MLKELVQKIQDMARMRMPVDPSRFNDPVALQTLWTPAKGGGANFRTHKLVEVDSGRLEFRASWGAKLFYLVFLLLGLGLLVAFSAFKFASSGFSFDVETIMPLAFGLVFACVGGGLWLAGTAPIVFDRHKGAFWKGRKSPDQVFDKAQLKKYARFEDIHALQILSEHCRGNKSSYYSYELNLVLKDGRRLNVVDHGNLNKLRADALILSAFLKKPVWDVALPTA